MTLQEACQRFHLDMEILQLYEKNGLLKGKTMSNGTMEYQESELQQASQLHFLTKAGMDMQMLKRFAALGGKREDTSAEKIRLLRKCRYQLLSEIHTKQQILDQLDYLIREIKQQKT